MLTVPVVCEVTSSKVVTKACPARASTAGATSHAPTATVRRPGLAATWRGVTRPAGTTYPTAAATAHRGAMTLPWL